MNNAPKDDRAMSHEEIARRLGLTRSAVAKIEQRALRKLRLSLEAIGDHLDETATMKEERYGKAA